MSKVIVDGKGYVGNEIKILGPALFIDGKESKVFDSEVMEVTITDGKFGVEITINTINYYVTKTAKDFSGNAPEFPKDLVEY